MANALAASISSGSVEHTAEPSARMGTLTHHDDTVDENVLHANGILMRILEGRHVANLRRVKDRDVGIEALPQDSPIQNAYPLGRGRTHLPDSLLQGQHSPVANVA